jgi:hypothetical protein
MMEYRSPTLGKQLTEAVNDESLSDVVFLVGPERKIVRGLRIVIAARNAHLKEMLYGDREADGSLKKSYELPTTHALSFELMMKFVHSGGLSWEPHQTVQLLEVAIDFQVVVVLARCPVAASVSVLTGCTRTGPGAHAQMYGAGRRVHD